MSEKELTFLSTRGRGLGIDLALLKLYLSENHTQQLSYRFYLNNEMNKNPLAAHGYRRAKKDFCEGMTNALCLDASLASNMRHALGEGKRIMLSVPYDYQFKNMLTLEKGKTLNLNTLAAFEYVLAGSPFSERLLTKAYRKQECQTLMRVTLPFVWDLLQEEKRHEVAERIYYYFPEARGKRILSIIVYGDEDKKRKDWEHFSVKEFLKILGEDCFVFTNSEVLMENSFALSSKYRTRFGYINRILPVQEVLYITDALVTNNGRFAASFACYKKPIWACSYNRNWFEKYMAHCYPGMFLANAEQLMQEVTETTLTAEQQKFCRDMVYEELVSPYEAVDRILELGDVE